MWCGVTCGGSGVGRANNDGAFVSLAYHQSRNCKKKTPTDNPVDRVMAVTLAALLHINNTFLFRLKIYNVHKVKSWFSYAALLHINNTFLFRLKIYNVHKVKGWFSYEIIWWSYGS